MTHGTHRLVAFVDAIVAIAVTLLVLPLADAAAEADPHELTVGEFLREHQPTIWGFLLSFVVILQLWRSHHDLFEHVERHDAVLRTATFVWSLTIVVTPFTTQLIAKYGDVPAAEALYIVVLFGSSLCQTLMARWVDRHRSLLRAEDRERGVPVAVTTAVSVLFVVALLLALFVPGLDYGGLWILLLTRPAIMVIRLVTRRRRPSPAAPRP